MRLPLRATALYLALTLLGVCWTLAGAGVILGVSVSGIAIGALSLIPGGIGWVAHSADGWFGAGQLGIAAIAMAGGWGTVGLGILDLAWVDLATTAHPVSRKGGFKLLALNLILAVVIPVFAWAVSRVDMNFPSVLAG